MRAAARRCWVTIRDGLGDPHDTDRDATIEGIRRLRQFIPLVSAINLGYALYFWALIAPATDATLLRYNNLIGWIHVCSGIVLSLAMPCVQFFHKRPGQSPRLQKLLQVSLSLWALVFGTSLALTDQLVGSNTTNYVLATVVVGMMALLRPTLALALFVLSYAALFLLLPLVQTDSHMLDMARSHSFSAVLISFAASLMMWRQHVAATLLRRRLAELAQRDPLTGLLNRGAFMQRAQAELARARRYPGPTALLVADLDHFKKVNDEYGHPAGDAVLCDFAALLSAQLRESDIVGRLGGEEFIIMLPNTDVDGAAAVARKILLGARQLQIFHKGVAIPVTTSLGFTVGSPGAAVLTMESLYLRADQALYAAKAAGRNRAEQG